MVKVCILMSTYNGEEYLKEQIDSLLEQENINVDILIRDDGSSDKTKDILEEYQRNNTNLKTIFGKNIGFASSFMTILLEAGEDYDYYAFCDQDDYWEKNKLSNAIKKIISTNNKKKPVIYYSNLNNCDENLNFLYKTKLEKRKKSLESVALRNAIAGCTMVFDKKMFKIIKKRYQLNNTAITSHDSYLLILAYALGCEVICDSNSYIRYRKHNNNTSGSTSTIFNRIKKEMKIFIKKSKKIEMINNILNCYGDMLDPNSKKILYTFSNSNKISYRLKIIFSKRYTTGNILLTAFSKTKILFGRF